ncbi:MAG TPA: diguanylate cyclase, partial [Actinotalea sp.]
TPFGFAVACGFLAYALFRRDLLTLSPVARGLIVDQIGDAIVVLSPTGTVLDVNPAAAALVRSVHPETPRDLVGCPGHTLFHGQLVPDVAAAEVVSAVDGRRTELQVRASPLLDRRGHALGQVYVARDVTEANAQSRRLGEANVRLRRQIDTIEGLRAELAELAIHDPLTGMHNRRHMVDRFESMVVEAESRGESLAVVLLDVDLFKDINDEHGHLVGDAVLVALARRIQAQAPPRALVARWGGEEFFIALPGADAAGGLALADDIRRRCEREVVAVAGRRIPCTLSGGVASYPASGTTTTALLQAADASLYEAKRAGRNLVRVHATCVAI